MKMPALIVILLTATQVVNAALCGSLCALHTLRFNDDFDGVAVDEGTWNYRTDKGQAPRLSVQRKENVAVGNGYMSIILKNETLDGYKYTGGGLVSKRSFHYGYFEANMSLNDGTGWHSSFWLTAGNGTFLPGENIIRTEIDVFEVDSITPSKTRHNILEWKGSVTAASLTTGVYNSTFDFRDWHIWGFLWTEEGVHVWIDGVQAWTVDYRPDTWQHNLLNIWLTCVAYRDAPDNTKLPGVTRTSYIRYYQKDYYLMSGSLCDAWSQPGPCSSNAGYSETGIWSDSSLEGYTKGLTTRYTCGAPNQTSSWTTTISATGIYEISAFTVVLNNSDMHATYDVYRNGVAIQGRTLVDQTAGANRWENIILGAQNISISAGQRFRVTLSSSGNGCTRAGSIKFVRVA